MATKKKPQSKYHEFLQLVYNLRRFQKVAATGRSRDGAAVALSYEKKVDEWLLRAGFEAKQIEQLMIGFGDPPKKPV